jgi:hypothetical protein
MELVQPDEPGTGLSQQGTVDWTVLSQSTFSASLSILARLSAAGLEPLTIAIAQAMCVNIPIGICGEQKLAENMSSLKAFSSFGDAVWFGTGVRHILRTIVQRSQGASCVALAACLSETYSIQYSAQVFYEMVKVMESPPEFTPSFTQWESFVKVCAGIFATSVFGHKVGQMARLAGFTTPVAITEPSRNRAAEPRELAEAIYAIGKIGTCKLENIHIMGGLGCCWTMVFCDFLLGLRVKFTATDGTVLFQNFQNGRQQSQVHFHVYQASPDGLQCTSRTFTLNPIQFNARWQSHGRLADSLLSTYRIKRREIVEETFPGLLSSVTPRSFAQLLAASGYLLSNGYHYSRYTSAKAFIEHAVDTLPELQSVYTLAVSESNTLGGVLSKSKMEPFSKRAPNNGPHLASEEEIDDLVKAAALRAEEDSEATKARETAVLLYAHAVDQIQASCTCGNHPYRCVEMAACQCIISLAFILGELVFDDDLSLSRQGLRYLYDKLFESRISKDPTSIIAALLGFPTFHGGSPVVVSGERLDLYLRIFSGFERSDNHYLAVSQKISAMARSGIYCYVDFLRDPFQSFSDASRVHIGRGSIHTLARMYDMVLDQDEEYLLRYKEEIPKAVEPMAKSLIEESIDLRFWYEVWDGQSFESRHSSNPMLCLTLGWYGTKGFWFGSTTRLQPVPTIYSRGFGVPAEPTSVVVEEEERTPMPKRVASARKKVRGKPYPSNSQSHYGSRH